MSADQEDKSANLDRMVAHAYEAVLNQDRFDGLIALAEESIGNPAAREALNTRQAEIENHFQTAEAILSNLPKQDHSGDRPRLTFGPDLKVSTANQLATGMFDVSIGTRIEALDPDADALRHIRDLAAGRLEGEVVLRIARKDTGKSVLMALSRDADQSDGRRLAMIGVDRVWHAGAGEAMHALYGLTASENDVLALLVNGFSPGEAALERDRSVETVRQQIKSMISKTRSRGAGDLVALGRAVAQSAQRRHSNEGDTSSFVRSEIRLPDGRILEYLEQGDPGGRPILFLHGCLCGNRFPNDAARYFRANGMRVISPARPWHGRSDGHDSLLSDPARYADDLGALLDGLGLQSVDLVAFDVGAIFALVCLGPLSSHLRQVLCVSAQPPMRSIQDFASAPPQQKLFAVLPRVSVPLLSYMAKLGDRRLKRDGPGGFAKTVFGGAPADLEACRDPHLLDLFWQGHLFHVERGSSSFINDCRFVAADWEPLVETADIPVHFIHGVQNQSIRPERVLAFAERIDARATLIENAGHSLIFSHWKAWVRHLQ